MTEPAQKPEPSEADLIAGARAGDMTAFERLYRAHVARVHGLCLRMTRHQQTAEDLTQETFVNAWRSLSAFEGRSGFGTWLHRIAVNAVLGRIRKSKREHDRIQAVADTQPARVTTGDTGEMRDLAAAVDRLPEGARHVFVLHAVYGYSHDEAAEMLGIATGTSKAQMHRARRLLAQQLEEQGFES